MATITLTQRTEVDAPAETVWAIIADYARDPEWRVGVESMVSTPAGPVTVGTTTVEELRLAGKLWRNDGEVIAVEPGVRFEWRTTSGAIANGARSVEALHASRCRVRLDLNVTPTGANRLSLPCWLGCSGGISPPTSSDSGRWWAAGSSANKGRRLIPHRALSKPHSS